MHDPIAGPEPGLTRDPISAQYHWQDQAIELTDTAGWMKRTKLENYDEARGVGLRGSSRPPVPLPPLLGSGWCWVWRRLD